MIDLTEQHLQAVKDGEAIRLAWPELGKDVVLLRVTQYENIRDSLEDRQEQQAVLHYSIKQAAKVASENSF